MLPEWAARTAEQIFGRGLVQTGIYLILGGVDTLIIPRNSCKWKQVRNFRG